MTAEEKILSGITDDAKETAEGIARDAEERCAEIKAAAEQRAKEYSAKTVSAALLKAKAVKLNAQSAAELTVRDLRLKKRREEIDKTLRIVKENITALSDGEYFGLMTDLAVKYAENTAGHLLLGPADMLRDLTVFKAKLAAAGVNVTVEGPAHGINGGFILKYGDIEYNLSLDAVIADKREELEDKINAIFFKD